MKRLFYTMALVVIGITASYAQKPGKEKATAEQRAERAATALQQKLSLTADQKQKIQQIELDRIKQNDQWRTQDRTAMRGKMEERKTFMKANREKLEAVLTAEQKKTLSESRDQLRDRVKDRRDNKGPRGPRPGKGTPPPPPANNP